MRLLYTFLLYLITPLVLLRLLWKSRLQPEYRRRVGERFGLVDPAEGGVAVWVHAVSVGESLAALPLIEQLIRRHGEGRVWVTTTTPTGSERVQAALGQRVRHSYAPYDLPGSVARFLERVRPCQVVIMETELWPNLFRAIRKRGLPLLVANARLSPRSFRGYGRLRRSIAGVLADCTEVAAQSEADAERFRSLGAPRVSVMGNIKFDMAVPEEQLRRGRELRAALGTSRPVWIAASTHEGEEQAALDTQRELLKRYPDSALILVPRHPQRFDEVAKLIERSGLRGVRRSAGAPDAQTQVLLGDSMGEMFAYFAAADAAFVGGSLVPVGGHNVLEPAALGLPVLFGPQMHNFVAARDLLLGCGAAQVIGDTAQLAAALAKLFGDAAQRARMGQAGKAAVEANRGALARLLALLGVAGPA
ncbi:lipid IV(A) 3-deoxy-D-manno-octulosonic acid transferase [Nevskia soli]|uniref:lipid IV(A) 3-deoxy-D-manno-octulosonic acid transferase n=1 Tax=Nevskia soli TaxID=418856 RepID=UPI0004A786EA|nr:lipid IV(A) 3-deoxy-D-manno-octulosonic acid transferase [Nevskia soli]